LDATAFKSLLDFDDEEVLAFVGVPIKAVITESGNQYDILNRDNGRPIQFEGTITGDMRVGYLDAIFVEKRGKNGSITLRLSGHAATQNSDGTSSIIHMRDEKGNFSPQEITTSSVRKIILSNGRSFAINYEAPDVRLAPARPVAIAHNR
jgi:hypothetical protein